MMLGRRAHTPFTLDVEVGDETCNDVLQVRLRAPSGESLHEHTETVDHDAVEPMYRAIMTALSRAMGESCDHLVVHVSPPRLLELLDDRHDERLGSVERSMRAWTQLQLKHFASVRLQAHTRRQGQARARSIFGMASGAPRGRA